MPPLAAADDERATRDAARTIARLASTDPDQFRSLIAEYRARAEREPGEMLQFFGYIRQHGFSNKPQAELDEAVMYCARGLGVVFGGGRGRVLIEFSPGTFEPRRIRTMRPPPRGRERVIVESQRGRRRRRLLAYHRGRRGPPDDDDDLDQGRVAVSRGRRVA